MSASQSQKDPACIPSNEARPVSAQLECLQKESEADAAKRMKQEEELRQDVAEALEGFGACELDAEGLLAELRDLGIDVECSAEQLTLLARCALHHILTATSSTLCKAAHHGPHQHAICRTGTHTHTDYHQPTGNSLVRRLTR